VCVYEQKGGKKSIPRMFLAATTEKLDKQDLNYKSLFFSYNQI
jgi:hypothetical protein